MFIFRNISGINIINSNHCAILRIYHQYEYIQERPRDLLNKDKKQNLKIRLNKRHETYMQGLVEHQVESITDVLQLINIATKNRVTDSTNMNAVSSRSHMLMKMTVVIKLKDGTIRIANANFADLAGMYYICTLSTLLFVYIND